MEHRLLMLLEDPLARAPAIDALRAGLLGRYRGHLGLVAYLLVRAGDPLHERLLCELAGSGHDPEGPIAPLAALAFTGRVEEAREAARQFGIEELVRLLGEEPFPAAIPAPVPVTLSAEDRGGRALRALTRCAARAAPAAPQTPFRGRIAAEPANPVAELTACAPVGSDPRRPPKAASYRLPLAAGKAIVARCTRRLGVLRTQPSQLWSQEASSSKQAMRQPPWPLQRFRHLSWLCKHI
jgi:hypothetical protein